jgi:hypothetical protein
MSNISDDRIDDVAPGDVVTLDPGTGDERTAKVVFVESDRPGSDDGFVVTFETDDGETFQRTVPAGTVVRRELESKWESDQSPTPHRPTE